MAYTFFHIRAVDPGPGAERLNAFLARKVVLEVDRQFVADGQNSYWSLCVTTADAAGEPDKAGKPANRKGIDYKEVLSPEHFAVFARLRELRKRLAEEQDAPVYAIFTNEKLAAIAQLRNPNRAALASIEGIGEKRLELYAEAVLAELRGGNGQDPQD